MLRDRITVVVILLPIGIFLFAAGGWVYSCAVALILAAAAWEYCRLFCQGGYCPADFILIPAVIALPLVRHAFGFIWSDFVLALSVIAAMTVHVINYEKGKERSGTDFAITLGGILYLGWLGSYLISLRDLEGGLWWTLLVLPIIWLMDSGAFLFGSAFGKHKMSPRTSPRKSWEGYAGGILFGVASGVGLALLWHTHLNEIRIIDGLILGLILSIVAPVGDLGESMLKRQFGVKDSGSLLPGHGGIMDRIDTWIMGAAISYYIITLLK